MFTAISISDALDSLFSVWLTDSMPYKRKRDYRKSHAAWYSAKYRTEEEFREAEAKRKAGWYAEKASDPGWLA